MSRARHSSDEGILSVEGPGGISFAAVWNGGAVEEEAGSITFRLGAHGILTRRHVG